MGKKVVIAPSARRALHNIVQEIARDAPGRAGKFGDALLDRAEQVEVFHAPGASFPSLAATICVN